MSGRIADRLTAVFGDERVFKDLDDIPAGADFRQVLNEALQQSTVLLAIIGPDWLTAADDSGQRRLDNPQDYVRMEVETGLRRKDMLVIPVLINAAPNLRAEVLPEALRELAYRNAVRVRNDPDFRLDMQNLVTIIQQHDHAEGRVLRQQRLKWVIVLGVLAFMLTVVLSSALTGDQPLLATATNSPSVTSVSTATDLPSQTPLPPGATASPTPLPLTPTPRLSVSPPPLVTATDALAFTNGPTVAPTVRLVIVYDSSGLYVINPRGQGRVASSELRFEGAEGSAFSGSEWSQQYDYILPANCVGLEVSNATHRIPVECPARLNAVRTVQRGTSRLFWQTAFRVYWREQLVAECEGQARRCEVYSAP